MERMDVLRPLGLRQRVLRPRELEVDLRVERLLRPFRQGLRVYDRSRTPVQPGRPASRGSAGRDGRAAWSAPIPVVSLRELRLGRRDLVLRHHEQVEAVPLRLRGGVHGPRRDPVLVGSGEDRQADRGDTP